MNIFIRVLSFAKTYSHALFSRIRGKKNSFRQQPLRQDSKKNSFHQQPLKQGSKQREYLDELFYFSPSLGYLFKKNISIPVYVSNITKSIIWSRSRSDLLSCKAIIDGEDVDCVFASGRLAQLKVSLSGKNTGMIDLLQYLSLLLPSQERQIDLVTYQNGTMNELSDFKNMGGQILQHLPERCLCIGLFNPSIGLDSVQELCEGKKIEITRNVRRTYLFFTKLMNLLTSIKPDLNWIHITHGEASAIAYHALKSIPRIETAFFQKNLVTVAHEPVLPIPRKFVRDTYNTYFQSDSGVHFKNRFSCAEGFKLDFVSSQEAELEYAVRDNQTILLDGVPLVFDKLKACSNSAFSGKIHQRMLSRNLEEIRAKLRKGIL